MPGDDAGARWTPPMALWQLYLLMLATFGFYVLFWNGRLAGDLRRHVDGAIKPWRYVVGAIIPGVHLLVVYRLASRIRQLNAGIGREGGVPPAAVAALAAVIFCGSIVFDLAAGEQKAPLLAVSVFVMLSLGAVPWLLMQAQLNGFKLALKDARWRGKPFRFTKLQYLALSPGVLFAILLGFLAHTELERERGERLEPHVPVTGISGVYALAPPDDRWLRVASGTIQEDTDLELYGSTTDTWLVAYVVCTAGLTLDSVVEYRRGLIQAEVRSLRVSEERLMMADRMLPVSYASYQGRVRGFGDEQNWWVATVVDGKASIEVVAATPQGSEDEAALESLVRSLRLIDGEGEPCGAS